MAADHEEETPEPRTGSQRNPVTFDEQALADASIQGSSAAFEELYTRYFPRIRGFCLKKTSDPQLAEDIAQEAFTRAYARIEDFGGPKHFGGWVGTIASNLITDHYRRKRNTEVSLDADERNPGPVVEIDPIRNVQREDTSRIVRDALEKLDPRHAQALMMHEVKGMTCAAVGDALGISEVAAESLLARARRRLRKEVSMKAAPADLFGVGGLGLLPTLWRGWRRVKATVAQRASGVRVTAARGWDAVRPEGLVGSLDGAKALVGLLGAALLIEAAGAAAPPTHRADEPPAQPAVSVPAPIPADGDVPGSAPSERTGAGADLPLNVDVDPETGETDVSTEADVDLPVPGGDDVDVGDVGVNVTRDADGDVRLEGRVVVGDEGGDPILDTGEVEVDTGQIDTGQIDPSDVDPSGALP